MTLDEFMSKYKSPANERSLAKGIPIKLLPQVQAEMRKRTLLSKKVRYVFRGVSNDLYKRPQSYCHKDMADTFAIYERRTYDY